MSQCFTTTVVRSLCTGLPSSSCLTVVKLRSRSTIDPWLKGHSRGDSHERSTKDRRQTKLAFQKAFQLHSAPHLLINVRQLVVVDTEAFEEQIVLKIRIGTLRQGVRNDKIILALSIQ
eukprot:101406-Chlamydomonas_euryale.AAC.8